MQFCAGPAPFSPETLKRRRVAWKTRTAASSNELATGATPKLWPADKVARWPLTRLKPYARNARTHSAEQVKQIAASMQQWGWTNPILVDEAGEIIAGHGRVEAAKLLGLASVPVMVARGWTPDQRRAYVLADNQLALNANWDGKLLAAEVADLRAAEFVPCSVPRSRKTASTLFARRARSMSRPT